MRNWLLPEHIADILPVHARQVETAKTAILELFRTWGYQLVIPPLIEYTDSLLLEGDTDLATRTFKLDDPFSGHQLGLRADITPQVARIDAHLLSGYSGVTRLCYAGSIVHTRPHGLTSSREPLQLGAELYGCTGSNVDLEIIELMLAALQQVGVTGVHLDLGHVGIFHRLALAAEISDTASHALSRAVQAKDITTVAELVADIHEPYRSAFLALPQLYGSVAVLEKAYSCLPMLPEIEQSLNQLNAITCSLQGQVDVRVDLAELRGDLYTGVLFVAYAPGWSDLLARGGRYDNVGRRFGRARPAVGFSLDLRELLRILPTYDSAKGIRVTPSAAVVGRDEVAALRRAGNIVVTDYLTESAEVLNCDRELVCIDGAWCVRPLSKL